MSIKIIFVTLIFFYSILSFAYSGETELKCNPRTEYASKTTHAPGCVRTCQKRGRVCRDVIDKPSCKCKSGYIRETENGKCVPKEKCPKLVCNGENEYLSSKTPVCPRDCQNRRMSLCNDTIERHSCQCKDGYLRDTISGRCVHSECCPKCGKHEHLSKTTPICPQECVNGLITQCKVLGFRNESSCQCDDGFIRDSKSGNCIRVESCKKGLECNAEHEHLSNTTPGCPKTCQNKGEALCESLILKPSCQCDEGYVNDTVSKKCVRPESCPKELQCNGKHEYLSHTTPICPKICSNGLIIQCRAVGQNNVSSCQCVEGYVRDLQSGSCIREESCKKGLECNAEHEHLSQSTPACPETCQNIGKPRCFAILDQPSCQCDDGYVNDTVSKKCVLPENCPKELKCYGKHEHLSQSTRACPETCENIGKPRCFAILVKPSCQCNDGFVRVNVSGKCVRPECCPQLVCNGKNEYLSYKTPVCLPTCYNRGMALCKDIIHKPSCLCNSGTVRDTLSGKCVDPDCCPY